MEYKILAKSGEGEGLLPMKQSGELEDKKTEEQKNEELCNFVKNAFCVNGEVLLVKSDIPVEFKVWFLAKDKERGDIIIGFK